MHTSRHSEVCLDRGEARHIRQGILTYALHTSRHSDVFLDRAEVRHQPRPIVCPPLAAITYSRTSFIEQGESLLGTSFIERAS